MLGESLFFEAEACSEAKQAPPRGGGKPSLFIEQALSGGGVRQDAGEQSTA